MTKTIQTISECRKLIREVNEQVRKANEVLNPKKYQILVSYKVGEKEGTATFKVEDNEPEFTGIFKATATLLDNHEVQVGGDSLGELVANLKKVADEEGWEFEDAEFLPVDHVVDECRKLIKKVNKSKSEDYKGPTGRKFFSKDYPEGNLSEDWNSGIISFQKSDDDGNMIQIFAPEEETDNQWALSVFDADGQSLIEEATVQGIGDYYDFGAIALNTDNWATAWSKIQKLLNANPQAKELFGDFKVPAEAIDLMIKWNNLKDAGQKPFIVLKTLGLV